jgi:phthalate 4,5-cis-dihydrodiol dehydrogenase
MSSGTQRKLRLGVAGLGRAFSLMLPALSGDPGVALVAGADPRPEARRRFAADFSAAAYETAEQLCADPSVEVVYVASPHQHHAGHAILAAEHGKHALVEKPMALTIADCQSMIEAARRARTTLIVGHSHSFDAPIRRARALVESGEFGAVRMINAFNYTDFIYRPRRPEELDGVLGGGAVFNQVAHQVDIVRLIGGGRVRTVRAVTGAWDKSRPVEGAYAALLTFADGACASLTYSGYGNFDSDEFQGWIGEMGRKKGAGAFQSTQRFADAETEAAFKAARNYGGNAYQAPGPGSSAHQTFGTLIVSCEGADLRPLPDGVSIYRRGEVRHESLPSPAVPRAEVIDELYDAIVNGKPPIHDGAWAMATLEVLLAILRSAREGCEIALQHQVALP